MTRTRRASRRAAGPLTSQLHAITDESIAVSGQVEIGDRRGRTLGFPTANVAIDAVPRQDGVWAGWVQRADATMHPAAISVGRRSTIYGRHGVRLLEAHLLDFDDNLYGKIITAWLCHRLRDQRRFPSLDALQAQLGHDVAACRQWCQTAGVAAAR